jgi:hypothetical protein
MFPNYPLTEAPAGHDLYNINFKNLEKYLKLHVVSNGVRPLIIHTDKDLSLAWQLRHARMEPKAFEAAANVAMFVTDMALVEKALVARGAKSWPAAKKFTPLRAVKVARLKYKNNDGKDGNYDPEPLAWERFSRLMGERTRTKVDLVGPMPIGELPASGAQVAALTGTDQVAASADEIKALRAFVEGGGALLLEAAGGSRAFAESAQVLARQIVPSGRLRRLSPTAKLFDQKEFPIRRVSYRRWSRRKLGVTDKTPRLRAVLDKENRPLIFFSAEDLTAGLLGASCYVLHGYSQDSAFELTRNLVLSKARTLPRPQPKPTPTPRPVRRIRR